MGNETKIEWCDHTASPWYGCSHVHLGCDNCYAETMAKRNPGTLGIWGDGGTRIKSKSFIENLCKWNREAEEAGKVASVFPSMCDPFEDRPELAEWREEMFIVADSLKWIRLLLLTKRPENIRRMWSDRHDAKPVFPGMPGPLGQPLPCVVKNPKRENIWLLTSVSDQATADAMTPELLKCRDLVPVLGISAEPLLGPIDFVHALHHGECGSLACAKGNVDWVICGGESGHGARGCDIAWLLSIVLQCRKSQTACFVKQLGSDPYRMDCYGDPDVPGGLSYFADPIVLKDRKGGDIEEWPAGLRVRQMPEVAQ